ncbi:Histidinol-phosphate aminotransferase [Fundidesulfovibrio magnetotacticus]|uniref:Histidinol-phosphate aminotransferase n=1 Tax=Fundidesulfovibrio magnetotacticus TaxID=2730080 RepID=A0A6V8LTL5_9BACT|nr:histidinol-phosphate transaminase [Fundidesulfovibrio magnetotacticus]GFK93921.1 Histidinol-phosphate aminotransferase [Fundidesulfovibrio magnetotacticus]
MSRIADLAPSHVLNFESYVPSRPDEVLMRQYGVERLLRLNNNENALGPPPAAREALAAFEPGRGAVYPQGDCHFLREALGRSFGKDPSRFLVGNGSCEVITSVIKAFCQPGDAIVTADKTFAVYEWVAAFSGIEARLVPLRDYALDPGALLAAVTEKTKIVFVCNPNNPTGSWWNKATLERFLDGVAGRAVVVLDEAYREFVDSPDFPDGMEALERHPNVLVFRTFSKMYGLAAFRVGYLCGSAEAVDIVRRTHLVYSVNTPGQLAARAAVEHGAEHVEATRALVAQARGHLRGVFDSLGLEHVSGEGNFIMARAPMPDTLLHRLLMRQGVMVRTMTGFRFPNWIRVTLAGEEAMEAFAKALRKALDRS